MSRCFPYPPPGYTLSRANKEALIESVELQNERKNPIKEFAQTSNQEHKDKKEKSNQEHKDKKERSNQEHKVKKEKSNKEHKEKKEKSNKEHKKDKEQRKKDKEQRKKDKEQRKKDKEQRKKEKKEKNKKSSKTHHNFHKPDDSPSGTGGNLSTNTRTDLLQKGFEAEFLQKGFEVEADQLERSNLTEEHGQAICPNARSCSLDSTENSNKRKRQSSPEDVSRVHGKVIRIKLSKKPDDSGPSTSGRTQLSAETRNDVRPGHSRTGISSTSIDTGKFGQASSSSINGEQICSTSQQIKAIVAEKADIRKPAKIPMMSPMQKMELEYKTLFENLVQPQQFDAFLPDDDLDWLAPTKNPDRSTESKQLSGNTSMSCSGMQTLWPRAQYLQEVDVYALPYTLPF